MIDTKKIDKEDLFVWLCHIGSQFNSAFLITDPDFPNEPIVFANEKFTEITGYTEQEVLGETNHFLNGKDTCLNTLVQIAESIKNDAIAKVEILHYKKDGTPFWNDLVIQALHNEEQKNIYNIAIFSDITREKQQEAIVLLQQEIYKGIEKGYALSISLQKICDMTETFFPAGAKCSILQIANDETMRIAAAKSLPTEFNEIVHGLSIGTNMGSCGNAAYTKRNVIVDDIQHAECWKDFREITEKHHLKACWSFPVINHENCVIATFGIYFSEKRKAKELELEFIRKVTPLVLLALKNAENQEKILNLAYIDPFSKLTNYNYFLSEFEEMMSDKPSGFLLLIQPSGYTNIVDSYGKKQLASLLSQLSGRIRKLAHKMEIIISRSSEASLIIAGECEEEDIPLCMSRFLQAAKDPIILDGMELFISLRIGVVSLSKYSGSSGDIVRLADIALTRTKLQAGESVVFYEDRFGTEIQEKMAIQNALIYAIKNKEFYVHFQPKVNVQTGLIESFEALARWDSSSLGSVRPDVFIHEAESLGKIQELEIQIIEQVLSWLVRRKAEKLQLFKISVNISTNHFYVPNFVKNLVRMVSDHGIDPKYICLELTESIGLFDLATARKILTDLNKHGFVSSVDDFGKGFSSLSYIHQLPVSEIKIDRSFISNLEEPGAKVIVETIIQLAKSMKMSSVAEGIETEEQLKVLKQLQCPIGQGFYYYKPMSLDEIDAILRAQDY
ncbi:EAL domain-containing protein [Psychrobacillus sp.]|uniref:bifunctional diguanylate cyclase/phosphodiesterase n=1 Tax=Psychrobacillus sp. TaxID=1871623 RepID=UPI0028BE728D|nr:EAL domain-containing protein [Psychrobacillus sp.]